MTQEQDRTETVSLLQDLGLKEYEARCFMALTRLRTGTAKEISEISEVPRTRVYDAVRVLEAQGLVEVRHSNPQQFRAVDIEEATETLRRKFEGRIDTLGSHLESLDGDDESEADEELQEVWSLTGREAIRSRTIDLVGDATTEIVLIVVDESVLTDELFDQLRTAAAHDATVIVGVQSDAVASTIRSDVPSIEVFVTELDWLVGSEVDIEAAITRLLLVDRTTLLVGSSYPYTGSEEPTEQAIFATGLGNGLVVLIRRLLSTGLLPTDDPGQ